MTFSDREIKTTATVYQIIYFCTTETTFPKKIFSEIFSCECWKILTILLIAV